MDFRDRIVRLDRVPASQIENAEWNYRRHPQSQKEALAGSISELGFFKPLDVYVTEAGTYKLIDGQARRDLIEVNVSPETLIPCNVTNLSEAEAKKALLIADPLSQLAETDSAALESLMRDVQIADEDLAAMVTNVAIEAGVVPPESNESDGEPELKQLSTLPPPAMSWALIGIPTVRFGEIAERLESLATVEGIILETTSNNG